MQGLTLNLEVSSSVSRNVGRALMAVIYSKNKSGAEVNNSSNSYNRIVLKYLAASRMKYRAALITDIAAQDVLCPRNIKVASLPEEVYCRGLFRTKRVNLIAFYCRDGGDCFLIFEKFNASFVGCAPIRKLIIVLEINNPSEWEFVKCFMRRNSLLGDRWGHFFVRRAESMNLQYLLVKFWDKLVF